MTYDYYTEDEPDDVSVDCSVCGGDAPATLEWDDDGYSPEACFNCSECGEARCEDCRCKCEVEVDAPLSTIAQVCVALSPRAEDFSKPAILADRALG